ncbi:hypothetical protein H0N99_03385 [Candidatus Micrarchaeota archaeon]|nr:hypothetical protein [Candidatus Micrarchaeota archaeon]
MKFCILAVLLVSGVVCAADLTATITGDSRFAGPNCRIQGDPNYYDVGAIVINPSSDKTLGVSYLYYNASSGGFEDGGKVCNVGAGLRQLCNFRVYTISGGKNGTDEISFKVVGWVGDICGNGRYCAGAVEYDTVLSVTVNHTISMYEQNVLDKLNTARSEYNRVSAQYGGSCYNQSGHDLLQNASSEILDASSKLSICDTRDALNTANDAINKIHAAEGYTQPSSCQAPPVENKSNQTQLPPPQNNTTWTPPKQNQTLNQTQNNTPAENLTNITSTLLKGCIPFCVLIALLLAAVWSDRNRN